MSNDSYGRSRLRVATIYQVKNRFVRISNESIGIVRFQDQVAAILILKILIIGL